MDVTLKLVPGLTERLTAGLDVADIACGSGHALNLMAQAFPASRFTGYDFSAEGIAAGSTEAEQLGLTNTRFVEQDVATLNVEDAYDFITIFDAIHDQAQPRAVLRNIARALCRGGTLLAVDVQASSHLHENMEHPLAPSFYAISTMHCMTRFARTRGRGSGEHVGGTEGARVADRSGARSSGRQASRRRHHQQLLHLHQTLIAAGPRPSRRDRDEPSSDTSSTTNLRIRRPALR